MLYSGILEKEVLQFTSARAALEKASVVCVCKSQAHLNFAQNSLGRK